MELNLNAKCKPAQNRRLANLKRFCQAGKAYNMPYSAILEADLREGAEKNMLFWRREENKLHFQFFDYVPLFPEVQG